MTTEESNLAPREGLLRRLPTSASRVKALDRIHEQLASATMLFEISPDAGRAGVWRALIDVVEYFSSLGIPRATLAPLFAAATALVDADNGASNPLFARSKSPRGGKPPKSAGQVALDQYCAVITECCVRHERAKGERAYLQRATRLAAGIVNGSALGLTVTATQMREVREKITQLPSTNQGRAIFDDMLSSQFVAAAPLEWARMLADHDWQQRR